MRYGSVCSGIEAAHVAWAPLGWEQAWSAEIEAFPSAVLAHHYPNVPNLGDMTKLPQRVLDGEVEAPDILVGGTPCQAFSVAGQRQSLADARGNLTLTFVVLADAIESVRRAAGLPGPIVVWENVPGVLNTPDNAFGCFLGGLAGSDEALRIVGRKWPRAGVVHGSRRRVAWCVLDAQYFGVAQRRRRVFVVAVPNELVASLGDRCHPAEILSIGKSLRRDTPTRGTKGERVAPTVSAGPPFSRTGNERVEAEAMVVAKPLGARGGVGRMGLDNDTYVPVPQPLGLGADGETARALTASHTATGRLDPNEATYVAHPLRAQHDASEDGTGRGTPKVPVSEPIHINTMVGLRHEALGKGTGLGIGQPGDPANTLSKSHSHAVAQPIAWSEELTASIDVAGTIQRGGAGGRKDGVAVPQPLAFEIRGGSETDTGANGSLTPGRAAGKGFLGSEDKAFTVGATQDQYLEALGSSDLAGTLMANQGSGFRSNGTPVEGVAIQAMRVRRLTPRECERLQGFPDDYTLIQVKGKPAADGPRYKALGNSMAVPVMAWIGNRIEQVQRILTAPPAGHTEEE